MMKRNKQIRALHRDGTAEIRNFAMIHLYSMKIKCIFSGSADSVFFRDAFSFYKKRIIRYVSFSEVEIPLPKVSKTLNESQLPEKEYDLAIKHITPSDQVILLDERGKEMSSLEFAAYLQSKMNCGIKNLVFVTGGPYGFCKRFNDRAHEKISLSRMTFPHQMVRVIFAEQMYRALSILQNEPYHHE